MAKRGPRRDYTDEDVREIRRKNKETLDKLFSNPNWRYELGKKHFGEKRWQKVFFGEDHPDYWEWKWDPNREKSADTTRPISEYTKEGELLGSWENVMEMIEERDWNKSKAVHIIDAARGKQGHAYGKVYKFDDLD